MALVAGSQIKHKVTSRGLEKFEERTKNMAINVRHGSRNMVQERAETDLTKQNFSMPKERKLKDSTIEKKKREGKQAPSRVLFGDGDLVRSGFIRMWMQRRGKNEFIIRYSVRRKGSYSQGRIKATTKKTKFSTREGKALRVKAAGPVRQLYYSDIEGVKMSSGQLKKFEERRVKAKKKSRFKFKRAIRRETVAGILKHGEKKRRRVAGRPYHIHGESWEFTLSKKLMREHISKTLAHTAVRGLRALRRDVWEIVTAASEVP